MRREEYTSDRGLKLIGKGLAALLCFHIRYDGFGVALYRRIIILSDVGVCVKES